MLFMLRRVVPGSSAPCEVLRLGAYASSLASEDHPHLPRARSLQQAPSDAPGDGIPRSVDAPVDPYEKRHRDTTGIPAEEVDNEVKAAVSRAGARATEALGGRANELRADPSLHMAGAPVEGHGADLASQAKDWANQVVGDGVKETVKQGTQKAKDALNKMFSPGGRPGVPGNTSTPGGDAREDTGREAHDAAMKGQLPGARRRTSGDGTPSDR